MPHKKLNNYIKQFIIIAIFNSTLFLSLIYGEILAEKESLDIVLGPNWDLLLISFGIIALIMLTWGIFIIRCITETFGAHKFTRRLLQAIYFAWMPLGSLIMLVYIAFQYYRFYRTIE